MPEDPSKPLKNSRHEAFAVEWAKGGNLTAAALAAGYTSHSARKQGSVLGTNTDIVARREWLQKQVASRSILSRDDGLKILAEIAQNTEEPGQSRTGALKVIGQWCGWEKGTEAERTAAAGVVSLAAAVSRIRSMGRK